MELPISKNSALAATEWLKGNFGEKLAQAATSTAFTENHLCGIVCQESAYRWLGWRKAHSVDEILAACVLDGSGDVPGTSRGAFPRNTAEFRTKYGDTFTNQLIAEGNKMRELMGWSKVNWLYKGYGIFQFDLQFVTSPKYLDYFQNRRWHDFDRCLALVMEELDGTWKRVQKKFPSEARTEQIRLAIKAYNGSGAAAEAYSHNVMFYTEVAGEIA
jgi:hypothetical protein